MERFLELFAFRTEEPTDEEKQRAIIAMSPFMAKLKAIFQGLGDLAMLDEMEEEEAEEIDREATPMWESIKDLVDGMEARHQLVILSYWTDHLYEALMEEALQCPSDEEVEQVEEVLNRKTRQKSKSKK